MEVLLGDLTELVLLAYPGARPQHVDRALFLLDRVEQTVQIVEVGRIALHAGHVPADLFDFCCDEVGPASQRLSLPAMT